MGKTKHPHLPIALLFMAMGIISCLKVPEQFQGPAPGIWRATLKLEGPRNRPQNKDAKPDGRQGIQFEEVVGGELPFTFEVVYEDKDKFHVNVHNGEETIRVDDIQWGWDKTNGNDTIIIDFPHYDSYIKALYEENVIEGEWVVETKENYSIPFVAKHGQSYRFSQLRKPPAMDVGGEWEVTFDVDTDEPYKAIGEFKQDGNRLQGTFRTETGDYRFLDGTIQADKMYLSCFDGSHAFLFEAKIQEDGTLLGSFRSGKHYRSIWEARRNPDFQLASADSLTYLKEGFDKMAFTFPNAGGKAVSLDDPAFAGKFKIVQILGTWCPNCADETAFLTKYLKENPSDQLAVIGLAFEKHRTPEKAYAAINTFKKRFDVQYEVLWAGSSNKKEAAENLPMLNAVISYPTMIFLDQNNRVLKIHTGFSGPATSQYPSFKMEFDSFIKQMLGN